MEQVLNFIPIEKVNCTLLQFRGTRLVLLEEFVKQLDKLGQVRLRVYCVRRHFLIRPCRLSRVIEDANIELFKYLQAIIFLLRDVTPQINCREALT